MKIWERISGIGIEIKLVIRINKSYEYFLLTAILNPTDKFSSSIYISSQHISKNILYNTYRLSSDNNDKKSYTCIK